MWRRRETLFVTPLRILAEETGVSAGSVSYHDVKCVKLNFYIFSNKIHAEENGK